MIHSPEISAKLAAGGSPRPDIQLTRAIPEVNIATDGIPAFRVDSSWSVRRGKIIKKHTHLGSMISSKLQEMQKKDGVVTIAERGKGWTHLIDNWKPGR